MKSTTLGVPSRWPPIQVIFGPGPDNAYVPCSDENGCVHCGVAVDVCGVERIGAANVLGFLRQSRNKERESLRHQAFPGGPPSKYYPGPTMLNFRDRTRTGVFIVVWS